MAAVVTAEHLLKMMYRNSCSKMYLKMCLYCAAHRLKVNSQKQQVQVKAAKLHC